MPSGAKKRKAAKKKMVQQTHSNNPNSSIGEDEVKNFDEKDSDGGDVSSPASQEHRSPKHPFGEGGEEEVEKREDGGSSAQLIDPKKNPEEEGIVQVEWDMKSEEDLKSKDISIESSKKGRGSSSSSSSSSDSSSSEDESREVEKKIVEVETSPTIDLVKPVESLSAVLTTVGETDNGAAVETEHTVDSINPDNGVAHLMDPEKVSVIEEVVHVIESTSIDSPVAYSVVDLGLQENVEKNEVVSTLDEKNTVVLDALDSATEVHEHKHVPSLNDSNVCSSNAAEHVKDSQSPECSDSLSQPLIATAPETVQRTSFKSCCGLFDLFTGADR